MQQNEQQPKYRMRTLNDHLNPKWYNARYQSRTILRRKLQDIIDSNELKPGETLVDYGCGSKPYEPLFKNKFAKYLGADLVGNPDADITITDQGKIPLDDNSVDCVLSVQVLEHVISPQDYLAQALRILKPGGSLILSTHGIWPYHPDPNDYWRWTVDGLQLEIQRSGFEITSVSGVLSKPSIALQFWQDATVSIWPRYISSLHNAFFQLCIRLIESRKKKRKLSDSAIFVVHARKPGEA